MGTIQVISKTYCCNQEKDRNIFNEDLESESEDDNEDDKQVIEKIESFNTDINKSQLLEI